MRTVTLLPLVSIASSAFAATVSGSAPLTAQQCCSKISSLLPGKVFLPGSGPYESQQSTYYSENNILLEPSCRVTPFNTSDVSMIISTATQGNCSFAVRSGGHMNWGGSSNIGPNGFTIDMQNMTQFQLSADKSSLAIGPGFRWEDIYTKLTPFNITVSGGRSAPVGVGGFLVGGGFSFLSPRTGISSNHIIQHEVVLSNGSIVTASKKQNPSLYFALKLGSTNFGVVTKYTLETFPLGGMWGGSLTFNESQARPLMDYLVDFNEKLEDDLDGFSGVSVVWDTEKLDYFSLASNAYLKPISFPPLFSGLQPFVPLATSNTLAVTNLTTIAGELATGDRDGTRTAWWTLTYTADAQAVFDLYQQGKQIFADMLTIPETSWSLNIQPINKQLIRATIAGDSPAGLVDPSKNLFLLLEHVQWTNASIDDAMMARSNQFLTFAQNLGSQRGLLNEFLYLNYAGQNQSVYDHVGNASLSRLLQAKTQYDPLNQFGTLWSGGYKL